MEQPASAKRMAERVYENARTRKEAFGPASQAEMYLARALEEFHHASNAPDLWVEVDALHKGSLLEGAQASLTASNRRLRFLRGTVLFAALSVEAFANELLADLLPRPDWRALDQLQTPEKLLIGTRLAGEGTTPLDRGAEPLQSVSELVKVRNRLVHARPQGGIAAWIQDVEETDESAIGPAAALNAIMRVAEIVVLCTPLRSHPERHGGLAKMIVRHASLLKVHNELGGAGILDVPSKDVAGVPPLHDQMMETVAASGPRRKRNDVATSSPAVRSGSHAEHVPGNAVIQDSESASDHGDPPQAAAKSNG